MPEDFGRRRAIIVPSLVFIVVVTGLSLAWWGMDRQWQANTQAQLRSSSVQASHRLREFVESRLSAVRSVGDSVSDNGQLSEKNFVRSSLSLQENLGGFQALNWVNANGIIQIVVPRETNLGALGQDLGASQLRGGAFRKSRRLGTPQMTEPIPLFQGGQGFAAYLPVVRNGEVIGYLNAVFRIKPLVVKALGAGVLDSHTILIKDGNRPLYESPNVASGLERFKGVAPVKILGREWTLVIRPNDALWAEMRAGRPLWIFVLAFALAAGACWLLRGALMRNWREADERRQRQQLQLELERSAKMQALGRLAGGIAHDFNNILTAIVGNAEIIKLTAGNSSTVESAKDIVTAAELASDLTRQLLAFSNQPSSQITSIDVSAELGMLKRMLTRLVSENIVLEFSLADSLGMVLGNRAQVSQIVVNLVVNAADAMPDGGQLTISTRASTASAPNHTANDERRWVVLSVADSGIGMDAETQARIFEPFFSTKGEAHSGVGLGLATVYGIVNGLEGELRVESEAGVGTTFEVWLPVVLASSASEVIEASSASAPGPSRRVLFVEDNTGVRDAIVKTLEHYGHIVDAAKNGSEALKMVETSTEAPFDIVVTDAVMPGISGPEMVRILREQKHALPIIICSGYSEELSKPNVAIELGAQLLPKPYEIDELISLITRRDFVSSVTLSRQRNDRQVRAVRSGRQTDACSEPWEAPRHALAHAGELSLKDFEVPAAVLVKPRNREYHTRKAASEAW